MMAEKAAWEKAIVDMRAAGDKHKADLAALTAAPPVVDAELATAAKALADAVQASMEKRAVVTAKQAEVRFGGGGGSAVRAGLGRTVAMHHCSSTVCEVC